MTENRYMPRNMVEEEIRAVMEPYLLGDWNDRVQDAMCEAISNTLMEMAMNGVIPASVECQCGILAAQNAPPSRSPDVTLWLADSLQIWLWGEVRTKHIEGQNIIVKARTEADLKIAYASVRVDSVTGVENEVIRDLRALAMRLQKQIAIKDLALDRAASLFIGVNTSARNQCLKALVGKREDEK